MLISQQGIHIELNKDEQHIQIGNSDLDCHRFTIEILWLHCEWLTSLRMVDQTKLTYVSTTHCYAINVK